MPPMNRPWVKPSLQAVLDRQLVARVGEEVLGRDPARVRVLSR
jgi:hypothetical protein